MSVTKRERVVFYSKHDGAGWPNLRIAENLLRAFRADADFTIRDVLELYHVKQYFDNDVHLPEWSAEDITYYKGIVPNCWIVVKNHMLTIDNNNILDNLNKAGYDYNKSFWELVEMFQIYKKLDKEIFALILNNFSRDIEIILSLPSLAKHFHSEIKTFLLSYDGTAELLIANTEEKERSAQQLHFPKSLTLAEKELIISTYLDSTEANLNYVRLIVTSRDTPEFRLTPKVRLKAKKKSEELNNRILEEGYTWSEGVEIAIAKDQDEPIKMSHTHGRSTYSYSESYLDAQLGNIPLFNIFSNLFHYTDQRGLIALVSHNSELDILEKTQMKSKNEYETGTAFMRKRYRSEGQLVIYNHYLKGRGLTIEKVVKGALDELAVHFELHGLRFNLPSEDATYLEKIRTLAPELEFLLKQYQAFVEDGVIDFELLELQSNPTRFSDVPSLCETKYIYPNGAKIVKLKNQFFSDQAFLHYVKPFENKHRNLYQLLTKENVTLEQFKSYQSETIKELIDEGYLCLTKEGFVKIQKAMFISLLGDLYRTGELSYYNYPCAYRAVIDQMIADGLVVTESKLFSRQEQQYLNFYLNKKEFTNGLDLRNKYLHGTNSGSTSTQQYDYNVLLKILKLIVLKIKDDLVNSTYRTY